jgi:hypothetical protein
LVRRPHDLRPTVTTFLLLDEEQKFLKGEFYWAVVLSGDINEPIEERLVRAFPRTVHVPTFGVCRPYSLHAVETFLGWKFRPEPFHAFTSGF